MMQRNTRESLPSDAAASASRRDQDRALFDVSETRNLLVTCA
jgi:hypothetical protein